MRLAAADLGTNSFHLVVAEAHPDGTLTPLVREKEMLRLGDVVSREGRIPPVAADRAVATVRRFRLLAESAGATDVLARATSALRRAENGDEVADRIEVEAGVTVDVIDGLEEARLIFAAVRASVVLEPGPALCLDVGGGSVEVMVGDAGRLHLTASEPLGVARLTADCVRDDPPSAADRRRLRERIVPVLAPLADRVGRLEPRLAVGSSGTLEALARIAVLRRGGGVPVSLNQLTVTRAELEPLHDELLALTTAERRRVPGLEARRADLIVAGSTLLLLAMDALDFEELTISEWALREGILLDAIGRHETVDWSGDPRAIRRASVAALARRYRAPQPHSRHVAKLARALFDATSVLHRLGAAERELLDHAARLHDIGEHVAHDGHERHGAYLVLHAGLRGFDPDEVLLLAAVVRWHRRGEPRTSDPLLGDLEAALLDRVRHLAAILRVADGLDRARRQTVRGVRVRIGPSLVLVQVQADRDPELELWGARRKRELFERVFGRDLELSAHPAGAAISR